MDLTTVLVVLVVIVLVGIGAADESRRSLADRRQEHHS